jgi:uncharacterized protein involved in response to NO
MIQHPLFSIGFRPFFLVAGIFSVLLMLLWTSVYWFSISLPAFNYYSSSIWHAHEMIFGYSIAIISGFLLTAISNWTGLKTVHGNKLAFIVLVWILGRIAPFISVFPNHIMALTDILFLPLLIYFVAQPLIKSSNKRNYFIIALLGVFCILNILLHLHLLGYLSTNPNKILMLSMYLIIVLISVMAGRVFPMFSQNGVKNRYQVKKFVYIEKLAVASVLIFACIHVFISNQWLLFLVSMVVFLIHLIRLIGWYNQQIWQVPLVWVLHLGYFMLVLGFGLGALESFYPQLKFLTIHAFTIGVIGVLTLGMISRVSLGHTGRNINRPPRLIFIAFTALILSVVIRVFIPILAGNSTIESIIISGLFWVLAFILFLVKYSIFLIRPRADSITIQLN